MDKKNINNHPHILHHPETYTTEMATRKSKEFYEWINKRRTVREISKKTVPKPLIEQLLLSASSAPSGAHKQPWTFCAVNNPKIRSEIRAAAEYEEYESYNHRMSDQWLDDLEKIGTDWKKPFLEEAPWLIIVFKRIYEMDENGNKRNNYYVNESVGIACGFLIAAIHNAGLVTLTHTPSPMNFLSKILKRPENERPFLLLPVGYPKDEVYVPELRRKSLKEMAVFFE
ncbi:MAG TPA: nitroreductase family protein [Cyclobacteriaceae bacterium]